MTGYGDAAQHGLQWHRIIGHVFARLFRRGQATLGVEMPTHTLAAVLHFHGKITVQRAVNYPVVTDGPIAIQAHAREANDQGVSGRCCLDVERPCYGIASEDASYALLVGSAGVYRRGESAASVLLPGFSVAVAAVFDAD